PEHYTRGWHATSTLGTLGCAAAAARLLRLDVTQTRHALAIAATHASGLKENFGSMTKPYHAGHAALSGIRSAQLAREGLTGSDTALEASRDTSPRSAAPGGSSSHWTGSAAPGSSSPRGSRSSPTRRAPSPTRRSTHSSSCAPLTG